jgi:hypothetical protein
MIRPNAFSFPVIITIVGGALVCIGAVLMIVPPQAYWGVAVIASGAVAEVIGYFSGRSGRRLV